MIARQDWAREIAEKAFDLDWARDNDFTREDVIQTTLKLLLAERARTRRVIRQWAKDESLTITVKTLLRRL